MTKRPSLVSVMDKSGEKHPTVPQTPPAPTRTQRKLGKKQQGYVQLNTYVPEQLRTRAKVKALQTNRDLSDVVTELLEGWVKEA